MRRAFDEAKSKANSGTRKKSGAVLLIDECDSFPDRSKVKHDHRDYVIEIVNALLEQLDGAVGREGVIVIGTTNDMGRCDPAMLRPRRLSKVITVGFPTLEERVSMLRVRLGPDLADAELTSVARLTERATGADIEELVSDARRIARQAARPLTISDLLSVAGKADADLPTDLAFRTAVHEAGHAVVTAVEVGTDGLIVALQSRDGSAGWVERIGAHRSASTRADIETVIRIQLAGRAAEETLLGSPSAGARQDLADATTLAANIVGAWGLGDGLRLLSLATGGTADLLADPGVRHEAAEILDALYGQTLARVRENRDAVLRIANRLMSERRLDGAAVAALIGPAASPTAHRGGTPLLSRAYADAASGPGGAA